MKMLKRLIRRFIPDITYLRKIEALAKSVVAEAIEEGSFEVFILDEGMTPFQQSVSLLARELKYKHTHNDGCCTHEETK